jgi:hypothetical protein
VAEAEDNDEAGGRRDVKGLFVVGVCWFLATQAGAAGLLPWQKWVDRPEPSAVRDLGTLFDGSWVNSGGKEGQLAVAAEPGPWGGEQFEFKVKIDHFNEGPYPQGWPSFETRPSPNLDWSGWDTLRYWIRVDTDQPGSIPIRFILWTHNDGRINEVIPGVTNGQWVQVTRKLTGIPYLDQVDRVHFFLCESDYAHGQELTFHVGGFQLCRYEQMLTLRPPHEAAAGLWLGERADTSERIVMLDEGTAEVPALLAVETGADLTPRPEDELRVKYHEVFSGRDTFRVQKLGQVAAPGAVTRVTTRFDVSGLEPGYYLVVADIRRDGKSVLGGLVGSDDLYIRRPGESMTYSVLSIRTGMVMWLRDQLYGDIMGWAFAALPHVYDPLDPNTYPEFARLYVTSTGKHTEGNEAGDTGLAYAAAAFRKAGDMTRCRFTEWLMEDSFRHMIARMQAPSGGTIMYTDELGDAGVGTGRSMPWGVYDSNQIGEWMRAITYGIIYFAGVPDKRGYARELSAAVRKAADYLVAHAVQDSDGLARVMRHVTILEKPDGSVEQVTYQQEGRQCDVYLGRALSGLSYYAYAMQLLGEKVPDSWWEAMANTTTWADRKLKPNGWFDWQCEDIVEGGCHTFLGNIYIGEGLFGICLAARQAGREDLAQRAAEVCRRTYRYVTDDCWIKGTKYEVPGAAEFWVGPYMYWLFTQYVEAVGPEAHLADWLTRFDKLWSEEHAWKDFLDRPRDETGYVGRSSANGMLNVAVLAYPAIKSMDETGQPGHWGLP